MCVITHIKASFFNLVSYSEELRFDSSCFGNCLQQPSEQGSQLIEVIWARKMDVFADRDFITLSDVIDAEDNNGYIFAYPRVLSNAAVLNNR